MEGVAPGAEVSFEEVGAVVDVAEVGLWALVTPVLEVSCSGRRGAVEGVLPGGGEVWGMVEEEDSGLVEDSSGLVVDLEVEVVVVAEGSE